MNGRVTAFVSRMVGHRFLTRVTTARQRSRFPTARVCSMGKKLSDLGKKDIMAKEKTAKAPKAEKRKRGEKAEAPEMSEAEQEKNKTDSAKFEEMQKTMSKNALKKHTCFAFQKGKCNKVRAAAADVRWAAVAQEKGAGPNKETCNAGSCL